MIKGWIVMPGAEYEGLWPDEPHTVYFDKAKAEKACKALYLSKTNYINAPEVVEVRIDGRRIPGYQRKPDVGGKRLGI